MISRDGYVTRVYILTTLILATVFVKNVLIREMHTRSYVYYYHSFLKQTLTIIDLC